MLDIKFIRENTEKVRDSLKKRGSDFDLNGLLALDEKRRAIIQEVDATRAKQNSFADEIAGLEGVARDAKIEESKEFKNRLKAAEGERASLEEEYEMLLLKIPNILADDVPSGKDERDNKVLCMWGEPKKFSFTPKDHLDLGEALDIIDVARASKVAGTRFNYFKGGAALLEFALIQLTLETLTSPKKVKEIADSVEKGYSAKPFIPVIPPVMIRPEVFQKMGRLEPKEERYYIPSDDIYLIGSAEHTLGSLHADEILEEKNLPIRYIGFSTSFRREAGSYGKDTRGVLRVHQFDKLEMESFTTPEGSSTENRFFTAIQEYLTQVLEIPYRVVIMCSGDTGAPNARQVDVEMWMPGQNMYRETHTADFMTDFQARRLNTRVRRVDGKLEYAHMNDATAFAIGRTIIAILENYQEEDGTVRIPKALQKYMGGMKTIGARSK